MILLGSVYSFKFVNAADGFKALDDNWSGIANKMSEDAIDTYPYDGNASDGTITSVSLDILYGTTRKLVTYHGEIPERETTTNDGKYVINPKCNNKEIFDYLLTRNYNYHPSIIDSNDKYQLVPYIDDIGIPRHAAEDIEHKRRDAGNLRTGQPLHRSAAQRFNALVNQTRVVVK